MNNVEKNMAVSALAQLLDQQPTAYAEVLAACRAMGWNASPTAQPADIIDELPSNVLPFIRRMLALLIYGDGSADSPAVVPVTERLYAQMLARQASPNYPAAGFPTVPSTFSPMTPSIRDFAHLPQALSALSPRKITNGGATSDGIPDGMSLAHLLCGDNTVTTLADDNRGWTMTRNIPFEKFPNLTKIALWCKEIPFGSFVGTNGTMISGKTLEELDLRYTEKITSGWHQEFIGSCAIGAYRFDILKEIGVKGFLRGCTGCDKIEFPALEKFDSSPKTNPSNESPFIVNCGFKEVEATRLSYIRCAGQYAFKDNADLHTLKLGDITYAGGMISNCPSLIYLQFEGVQVSLNLSGWSPTLDSSNLDQFLQNFKTYIAERLTDNGSGKTLTLSQAVYDAIKDETHLFVFDEGTMTIYAYLTNIKHWTVTK